MVKNIDKVIARGEKLDLLVNKTGNLANSALQFKKTSTALRKAMWWQNVKLIIILGIVLLVIGIVFVLMLCGPTLKKCI